MFLEKIHLKYYRNYKSQAISLKNGVNILIGDNGEGKTNLLESIYFLSLTKSHRINDDRLLINHSSKFFKIEGTLNEENIKTTIEIIFDNNRKIIRIDQNEIKKINEYLSKLKIIIFSPDDLEIIKGLPEIRRKYINTQIIQLYSNYVKIYDDYNKLLKARNEYIKMMRNKEPYNQSYFDILNDYYIKKSILIYKMRKKYVDKVNENIGNIFKDITNLQTLQLKYYPIISFENYTDDDMYQSIKNQICLEEEISYGKSIYGPHRDDFFFILNDNNLKLYGSQGQQRAAILALKLSEINIFTRVAGSTPIILLDDVFSELDDTRKNNLLKYFNNQNQIIITTTDLKNIDAQTIKKARIFEIKNGKIIRKRGNKNGN